MNLSIDYKYMQYKLLVKYIRNEFLKVHWHQISIKYYSFKVSHQLNL